jgi:hypothetical protein
LSLVARAEGRSPEAVAPGVTYKKGDDKVKVVEEPLCSEFLEWVDSQGEWEIWLDILCFKLCLACLLEGEWSLDKAKQFAQGENH